MKIEGLIDRFRGTPEADRLASAVEQTWIDLDRQVGGARTSPAAGGQSTDSLRTGASGRPTDPRALAAYQYLMQAEEHLTSRNLQRGWDNLQSAQRELLACDIGKAQRAAAALRREAEKITGWRGKAIVHFLDKAKGPEPDKPSDVDWILDAIALRDDYFRTTYFKIMLRRSHLRRLSLVLTATLAIFLALCWLGIFDDVLDDEPALVTAVIIFGILGASVSVSQGLLWSDIAAKIPAQQLGAFVVWMRPAIGAAAALAALVLLRAGIFKNPDPTVVLAIAFSAGFSERFIVGAVDRLARSEEKKSPG